MRDWGLPSCWSLMQHCRSSCTKISRKEELGSKAGKSAQVCLPATVPGQAALLGNSQLGALPHSRTFLEAEVSDRTSDCGQKTQQGASLACYRGWHTCMTHSRTRSTESGERTQSMGQFHRRHSFILLWSLLGRVLMARGAPGREPVKRFKRRLPTRVVPWIAAVFLRQLFNDARGVTTLLDPTLLRPVLRGPYRGRATEGEQKTTNLSSSSSGGFGVKPFVWGAVSKCVAITATYPLQVRKALDLLRT